jgi:hypothetical protein
MKLGEDFSRNEIERQKEINGQVIKTVDLREFDTIPVDVDNDGSGYDILLITPNSKFTARVRLALMVSSSLQENDKVEVRINKLGNAFVILKSESGFELKERGAFKVIFSRMIRDKLNAKNIQLPAQYQVTPDERIGGWVCRKID